MNLRAWLRAARPLAHGNIAPPIFLGAAMATEGRGLDLTLLFCAHLFGVLDHLVIVFANDFADEETDRKNANATPFSGGSRVLVRGELQARELGRAALVLSVLLLVFSALVALLFARPALPLFALAALGLLHAYSFAPLKLSYRGGGEILQGLGIGVVLPALGFYMQRGTLEGLSVGALFALFLFGVSGNLLTALPDIESDRLSEKHTFCARFGELAARTSALVLAAFGLGLLALVLHQRALETAGVMLLPCIAFIVAIRLLPEAKASHRRALLLFLVCAAGAMTFAELGWSLALLLR